MSIASVVSVRRYIAFVLLSAALFGSLPCAFAQDPASGKPLQTPSPALKKAQDRWKTAVAFQNARKYDEAIAAYKEFLALVHDGGIRPDAAYPAYQNLSLIYRTLGKTTEQAALLRQWSAADPKNPLVHLELASLYTNSRPPKPKEAAEEAGKVLALKATPAQTAAAHALRGIAAASRQQFNQAEQEFGAAIKLAPKSAQFRFNYALALFQQKRLDPALAQFQQAVALDPKLAAAYYYSGVIQESKLQYPAALKSFRQAVTLAPDDLNIYYDIARLQIRSGDTNGAISSFLAILARAPETVPARIAVAQLYVRLNNYAAARVHYTRAVADSPKNAQLLASLAQCETELTFQPQDPAARAAVLKQAEEHFKAASAIDPRLMTGPNSLARFYERTGAFEKAQDIYRKRMDADPNDFANVNGLAQTYVMQRKPDEAIAALRKYRDLHPDSVEAYAQIAGLLERQTRWEQAIAEWRLLLARKTRSDITAGVMVSIGRDLVRAGKSAEAIPQLEAVLKLDTAAPDAPKETRIAAAATVSAQRLEAMRELAQIAEGAVKFEEAARWLQQIKSEEANTAGRSNIAPNVQTFLDIARLYRRAGKNDLALKELEAALVTKQARREAFVPVYEEMGQVYDALKQTDDAASAFRRAGQLSKDPLVNRLRAAETYQRGGRLPQAILEYESLRTQFPTESRVLSPLAAAYRQAGRDEDAIKTYDLLYQQDPRAKWALDQKAVTLTHLKRYDDARTIYQDQLKTNPENRQLYANIAFVYQTEGKPDAFLPWVSGLLEKTPANATAMAVFIDEYIRQKRESDGWKALATVVERHRTRPVLEAAAALMAQHNRKQDALEMYRRIAAIDPKDLAAQVRVAEQTAIAGHAQEAKALFQQILGRAELNTSQKVSIRKQYAHALGEAGDTAGEMEQLREVVRADSDDFDSATRLAVLLEKADQTADAIPVYLNLAAKEVYPPVVRAQLRNKIGGLYLKTGNKTEATAQFRKALELNPNDGDAKRALKDLGVS